jgi:hypothetical protein
MIGSPPFQYLDHPNDIEHDVLEMIDRDTKWRQGSLLSGEDARSLGILEDANQDRCVVVISHDCDLPHPSENFVEVIVGRLIKACDPQLVRAKNPRKLHLKFLSAAGDELPVELCHADRTQVEKDHFSKIASGDWSFTLTGDEKRALKQWLAARYGRPAFPNNFETRLTKFIGKRKLEHQIAKILEPVAENLVAILFDLGDQRDAELAEGEPYGLSISVVYDSSEAGSAAREAAESVANEVKNLFTQTYGTADIATEIALEKCAAVSDTFVNLADLRKVDQWRVEYISLGEDQGGDFLATGGLST